MVAVLRCHDKPNSESSFEQQTLADIDPFGAQRRRQRPDFLSRERPEAGIFQHPSHFAALVSGRKFSITQISLL